MIGCRVRRLSTAAVDMGQITANLFTVGACRELERVHDCSHLNLVDLISQSSIVHDPLSVVWSEVVRNEAGHVFSERLARDWVERAVLLYMTKLRAATALRQFLFAGYREVPFLTVMAERVVHIVGSHPERSAVAEVPGVAKRAAANALFEWLLTNARKMDCEY
jgi:hypothetical protein